MQNRLHRKKSSVLKLPMNRRDIASYLALTQETVARGITSMENARLIQRVGEEHERKLRIRQRERLKAALPLMQSISLPPIGAAVIERIFGQ
jgi:DNA-binding MarR family transcriptional regulator